MAYATIIAAGDIKAHGFKGYYGGEIAAKVCIEINSSLRVGMTVAEARKLSDELLVAAVEAEAAAAEIIKGNADIAQVGQVVA